MRTDIDRADAFRYPDRPLSRRHGPSDYADYRSYRPWLRDEFAFRCVYCLVREQWGRATGEFDLDHFVPQVNEPYEPAEYGNMLYACRVCNLRKGTGQVPDPSQVLTAEAARVYPDGTMVALSDEADEIVRYLCLNSPVWKRWRRMWIRIVELALERGADDLIQDLLGFPKDLPNLRLCRAPRNARPAGIEESYFARRERGELPEIFVS
ncbi:MAG: HNH endonuclease signature motif containing protein [Pirellulales bacterium]